MTVVVKTIKKCLSYSDWLFCLTLLFSLYSVLSCVMLLLFALRRPDHYVRMRWINRERRERKKKRERRIFPSQVLLIWNWWLWPLHLFNLVKCKIAHMLRSKGYWCHCSRSMLIKTFFSFHVGKLVRDTLGGFKFRTILCYYITFFVCLICLFYLY